MIASPRGPLIVLLFLAYTVCATVGLLIFKQAWPVFHDAFEAGSWWTRATALVAAGAGLYAASFVIWLSIASHLPLTIAYPVAVGLSLATIMLGSVLWLGEPLTMVRVLGSALILVGIALVVR